MKDTTKIKKLPIGIQTFREIVEKDYLYVDKTAIAYELIENYKYSFLSRPRRFGKSLFLDTLDNIFSGNRELFKGLNIYDRWDWEDNYPVIKIDWAGDFKTLKSTHQVAQQILQENPAGCFGELIQKPVVILIDEYNKPILDNLDDTHDRFKEKRC